MSGFCSLDCVAYSPMLFAIYHPDLLGHPPSDRPAWFGGFLGMTGRREGLEKLPQRISCVLLVMDVHVEIMARLGAFDLARGVGLAAHADRV